MLRRVLVVLSLLSFMSLHVYAQGGRDLLPVGDEHKVTKRVALVIGNSAYEHAEPLQNPANDARDMANRLESKGFQVIFGLDLKRTGMERVVESFLQRIGPGTIATLYYAGHGIGLQGENFLIPVDSNPKSADSVQKQSLRVSALLSRMAAKQTRLNLLILDACRNDPFRSWRSNQGSGWAMISGTGGTYVLFGTSPGQRADDNRRGRNGLFTSRLLHHMDHPGLELREIANRVAQDVHRASDGRQQPWSGGFFPGEFYFTPSSSHGERRSNVTTGSTPSAGSQGQESAPYVSPTTFDDSYRGEIWTPATVNDVKWMEDKWCFPHLENFFSSFQLRDKQLYQQNEWEADIVDVTIYGQASGKTEWVPVSVHVSDRGVLRLSYPTKSDWEPNYVFRKKGKTAEWKYNYRKIRDDRSVESTDRRLALSCQRCSVGRITYKCQE